jgi:hypothetical protein
MYERRYSYNSGIISTTTSYRFIAFILGYRFDDAPIVGMGVKFKNLDVGYTYDFSNPNFIASNGGSHEVGIRFRFGKNKEGSYDNAF